MIKQKQNYQKVIQKDILLYGFNGCGKTFIAKSLQQQFKLNFIYVKGPEILDKYIGASEENLRKLFEQSENNGPSILFFDEFESIAAKRQSGKNTVTDRLVNQFLVQLDGVGELNNTFVLAATTRPDLVDPAILRPGRIDQHIFFDLPQPEDRLQFFKKYIKKNYNYKLEDQFYEQLKDLTQGFSFADMESAFKRVNIKNTTEFKEKVIQNIMSIKSISKTENYKLQQKIYKEFQNPQSVKIKKQEQILHQIIYNKYNVLRLRFQNVKKNEDGVNITQSQQNKYQQKRFIYRRV